MTAIVASVLRVWATPSASTRSLVWWCTLLAVLLGSDLRSVILGSGLPFVVLGPDLPRATLPAFPADALPHLGELWLARTTSLLLAIWALVATLRLGRLGAGLATLRRWRARCRPLPPSALAHLPIWTSLRPAGDRADVMVSPDVPSPCVLGLTRAGRGRPVIALPPAALLLPPAVLDAVLVHEQAHVQRRDDIGQFVQHAIAALCALHPAVWWISRQLSVEREAACDDWVVRLGTTRAGYADCLLALGAGTRLPEQLAVHVTGGHAGLAARITRLRDNRRRRDLRTRWPVRVAVPLAVGVVACLVPDVAPPPAPLEIARTDGTSRAEARAAASLPASSNEQGRHPYIAAPLVVPEPAAVQQRPARTSRPRQTDAALLPGTAAPARDIALVNAVAEPHMPPPAPTRPTRALAALDAASLPPSRQLSPTIPEPESPARTSSKSQVADASSPPSPTAGRHAGAPFRNVGLAVADAGAAVGDGAAEGGRATGRFFTRVARGVADVF